MTPMAQHGHYGANFFEILAYPDDTRIQPLHHWRVIGEATHRQWQSYADSSILVIYLRKKPRV